MTLLSDIRGVEAFDRVFQQIFRGIFDFADFRGELNDPAPLSAVPAGEQSPGESTKSGESQSSPRGTSATPGAPSSDHEDESEISVLAAMSAQERVNERDFSTLTPDELALIRRLVDQLPLVPPLRTRFSLPAAPWKPKLINFHSFIFGGPLVSLFLNAFSS